MKDCTIYRITDLIGKKWTLCILHELCKNNMAPKHFNELSGRVSGITPKVLSARLKELENAGVVSRKITDSTAIPPKTEYELTECGIEFMVVIRQLKIWGNKWLVDNEVCRHTICLECPL